MNISHAKPNKTTNSSKKWNQVALGLGGNIGDVKAHMFGALEVLLENDAVYFLGSSDVFETPPWGIKDQANFLNSCVIVSTSLTPPELLKLCHNAERAFRRERKIRWGPRTIDIDILMLEEGEYSSTRLTIPHPRIRERAFVLVPLAQIAGDWVLEEKSIDHWLDHCDQTTIKKIAPANIFDDLMSSHAHKGSDTIDDKLHGKSG